MNKHSSETAFQIFSILFFVIVGIVMIYPMWYVIMYSLSDPTIHRLNNLYLLPDKFTLDSYKFVFGQKMIYNGYRNTLFISFMGTVFNLFIISFTAYPLSKEKLTGKRIIFGYFLFTMLFNGGMIPTYLVVRQLGMVDKLWALFIPNAMNVFYLMVMIRFFKSISSSIIDSAKIDGCNEMYILLKIVFPLSTSVLAAIGLFCVVGYWNEYLSGVIYINSPGKRPLQVILYSMLRSTIVAQELGYEQMTITPESLKMSVVVVSTLR